MERTMLLLLPLLNESTSSDVKENEEIHNFVGYIISLESTRSTWASTPPRSPVLLPRLAQLLFLIPLWSSLRIEKHLNERRNKFQISSLKIGKFDS